ncbi:hypothetical protein SLEP1_g17637 [Rubroshorea leprosula]|uniref:Uncharacterized protein n=1 Tax=Rubroshorea leprosula TaxID=152421 RepID=A0AAV5IYK7_9ROSI|nr:hypothetical protein SLEP1_g17637 [Rubroshorea leprosula]
MLVAVPLLMQSFCATGNGSKKGGHGKYYPVQKATFNNIRAASNLRRKEVLEHYQLCETAGMGKVQG